jgi:hypothetical protein
VEEAFRKYASCLVETFKYQPKGDGITVAEICDRPEQAWICKVESFNWGRYFGIIESWHQKHRLLEEKTQESTFIDAYQSLQSARNSYRKCGKSFEKSLQEFYSHLKKHDRVMMLVKEFKLRINKVSCNGIKRYYLLPLTSFLVRLLKKNSVKIYLSNRPVADGLPSNVQCISLLGSTIAHM